MTYSYNHGSFVVTRRYLGVAQDDKNNVYMTTSGLDDATIADILNLPVTDIGKYR